MSKPLVTILGKTIRRIARIRGGGSALPGLIVEKIDPSFIKTTLSNLPFGVVVISGTNGKTTTTKIVVELLEAQGLKVFSNKTGSNFTRGIVASLLGEINIRGELKADIAVLELDEAHAVHFVRVINPRYCLLLNVVRDQLDRFGEIDYAAQLLREVANTTTNKIIANRDDFRIFNIAKSFDNDKVAFFGLDKELMPIFHSNDELHKTTRHYTGNTKADVELINIRHKTATYRIGDDKFRTKLNLNGIYNALNAAAALALVRAIIGKEIDSEKLLTDLSHIKPAFGRGESITFKGQTIELILVKNPSGFRLGLASFNPDKYSTMVVINDEYADGRDVSWLWDVDFSSLSGSGVDQISGSRAYDMALRLQYDDVKIRYADANIKHALRSFLSMKSNKPKRIYCTYTAMLTIRKELTKNARFEITQ